jgi:excisionase family DNA binding protein
MQFKRTQNREVTASAGSAPLTPRFLSVSAAARLLGMSDVTLYRAIHADEFPAIKIRGRYVIPGGALDAMEGHALRTGSVVESAAWPTEGGAA